ncbi:MAG: NADP-dependent oxidoreductase [Micrococcales bacterium]|nr:NADP-dependent oxidoreductase [Micrococcales bacterium]
MRAAIIDRFGGPDELHVVDDLPTPQAGPGDVLVRVFAAGVNPVDYKIRDGSSGVAKKLGPQDFPLVLGRECCGEVAEAGEGVTDLAVGQRVFGMPPMGHQGGCYAEYVALPAQGLALAPERASTIALAGTALAGATAWTAVHDLAKVTSQDIVLVHGGGGGVGQFIVQLAICAGATVYATASAQHHPRIQGWGATPIDYATQDFRQVSPRPTVIIDSVYFGTYEPSLDHLAPGGRLVILPTLADLEPARARGIDVSIPQIVPDRGRLEALAEQVADGRLQVEVSQVLPLDEAARAHEIVQSGHAQGKIVLTVA